VLQLAGFTPSQILENRLREQIAHKLA
jgi:hypothetical protein